MINLKLLITIEIVRLLRPNENTHTVYTRACSTYPELTLSTQTCALNVYRSDMHITEDEIGACSEHDPQNKVVGRAWLAVCARGSFFLLFAVIHLLTFVGIALRARCRRGLGADHH